MSEKIHLGAGSITVRVEGDGLMFLVVHRIKWDDYEFPKGYVGKGESLEKACVRETLEETGYPIKVGEFIGSLEYKIGEDKSIVRQVHYFLGEIVGEKIEHKNPDNIEGATKSQWLSYEKALNKLSYKKDKEMLTKALKKYKDSNNVT